MNEADQSPSPAPPEDDGYYDKFFVYNAADVRRHLQRLVDARCTLSAHAEGARESVVTALLQVEDASLWVDVPPGRDTLMRWLNAPQLRFEGSLERVALRFACGPAQLETHDGRPALLLPVPTRVLHLQRREFMRREPPAGALTCRFPSPGGQWIDATIRDIGGGGLAILGTPEQVRFAVGDVVGQCRIRLPELGEVVVDLRVRHVIERQHHGRDVAQAGCEFVDLDAASQRKLFRYLMQLDREELARRRLSD
ncbi:MAG TPA: flagellar regulator YcgR PilZN domain-containing protein [Xanthomonadaceae bacterium]|nr:flagellar regulator YcgR PilZN domain-containing protein [Xanthomonadaceae bacterium]